LFFNSGDQGTAINAGNVEGFHCSAKVGEKLQASGYKLQEGC
jgi:hypothetical protein